MNSYLEAEFEVDQSVSPFDTDKAVLAQAILRIIDVEGPVHPDVLVARVRLLWGLERAGKYTKWAVDRALRLACAQGIVRQGYFCSSPNRSVKVRDRSAVKLDLVRRPTMIPPAEIEQALLEISADAEPRDRQTVYRAALRAFGFENSSPLLEATVGVAVDRALRADPRR